MLKFVEIIRKARSYNSETSKCDVISSLEEVHINPSYIVSMKENTCLKEEASRSPLMEGLDTGLSFTELTMHIPGYRAEKINVVGTPHELAEKWSKAKK